MTKSFILALLLALLVATPSSAGLRDGIHAPAVTPFRSYYECYEINGRLLCYVRQVCYKISPGSRSTAAAKEWRCRWIAGPYS